MNCRCGCGEILINPNSKTKTNRGHHHRLPEIKEKKKYASLQKYGDINPSQSKQIKDKKLQTSIKHFGVISPMQNLVIQEKRKQTCLQNNGFEYATQSKEIQKRRKEKYKQTCLKKYGVDNWAKTSQAKKKRPLSIETKIKMSVSAIKRMERQSFNGREMTPAIGRNEIEILNQLQNNTGLEIIRNNRKLSMLCGKFPDGYILKHNLVIEVLEPYHFTFNNELCKYDKDRELIISSKLGCMIYYILEKDFLNNPQKEINRFNTFINIIQESNYENIL